MARLDSYRHDATEQDLLDTPCTVCGQHNLAEELCPNCKAMLECVECCGCYFDEEGAD